MRQSRTRVPTQGAFSAGFGLLEVLVSVLVLSVGLLGVAGMHVAGMKSNHSAFYRSQATILANDMLDRLRADRTRVRSGAYADVNGVSSLKNCESAVAKDQTDLALWAHGLCTLPSADGAITCQNDGRCTVTVQWDDSRPERGADANKGGTDRKTEAQSRTFVVSSWI